MTMQSGYLVDRSSTKVAALDVARESDRYRGTICLDVTPLELKRLFAEFEENVEGQMFTHADEIEEKIAAIPLKVVFANGEEADIADLQVYPSTKRVSFKTHQPAALPRGGS
jgi:ribosomal protein S1